MSNGFPFLRLYMGSVPGDIFDSPAANPVGCCFLWKPDGQEKAQKYAKIQKISKIVTTNNRRFCSLRLLLFFSR
ncbi:MAG: hypothetical protein MJ175_02800 [Clostridia bacterium]|nr:hypothetical protein [Clostridia bacterium]